IDAPLATRICQFSKLLESDPHVHAAEHSIEVVVPFVQHLWPQARLVPIMTPPAAQAHEGGAAVARVCLDAGADVVYLGSTDLTHYGPSFGFTPMGIGANALAWAKDTNDRRIIDLMLAMRADAIVPEAFAHQNACGPGAIAATIAACQTAGGRSATLLQHTTSFETLRSRFNEPPTDAVGYAGLLFDSESVRE